MQTVLNQLGGVTEALLKVSVQGSIVIVLVFAIQWLGGAKLSPRVRYALWLLVLARLLLPVSLPATFSIFNFSPTRTAEVFRAALAGSKSSAAIPASSNNPPASTPAKWSAPAASVVPPTGTTPAPATTLTISAPKTNPAQSSISTGR